MARQLRMVRHNLKNLPNIELPTDYCLRTYRDGDEIHWANIISDSFGGRKRTAADTHQEITGREVFDPNGLFFITHQETPVGTACAWKQSIDESDIGYVHMVGVLSEHTGQKLGKWISLAVLYYFREHGFTCAILDTDDFRLPALKTYLNLGFVPVYVDRTQPKRWEAIYNQLGLPLVTTHIAQVREKLPTELWEKVSR